VYAPVSFPSLSAQLFCDVIARLFRLAPRLPLSRSSRKAGHRRGVAGCPAPGDHMKARREQRDNKQELEVRSIEEQLLIARDTVRCIQGQPHP
jgi:hypothetical protein